MKCLYKCYKKYKLNQINTYWIALLSPLLVMYEYVSNMILVKANM